jgi:hypothetical protein
MTIPVANVGVTDGRPMTIPVANVGVTDGRPMTIPVANVGAIDEPPIVEPIANADAAAPYTAEIARMETKMPLRMTKPLLEKLKTRLKP